MTINHLSTSSSSYSIFEKKHKTINIHWTYSNLLAACSHIHTCCLLHSCSHPDSLAAAESRGLIGRVPCNGRFDWLSGWLPPCQLREHVCMCVCVCVTSVFVTVAANNQSKYSPLSLSPSLCVCLFFSFLMFGFLLLFSSCTSCSHDDYQQVILWIYSPL